jgi:phosphoglycolate phosphatase
VHLDAILFDLDGTLADTLTDIASSMNHVLAGLGLPAQPVERYRGWVGGGVGNLIEHAVDEVERRAGALAAFRAHYDRNLVVATAPYPGVAELLDDLSRAAVPMAVVSNKPDALTRRVVDQVLARWRFGAVLGQSDARPAKPDPAMVLEAARQLGVAPERCAMVGDTEVDMQTARAAGMAPVGVAWGFRPASLLAHGAIQVAANPLELLAVLASLGAPTGR